MVENIDYENDSSEIEFRITARDTTNSNDNWLENVDEYQQHPMYDSGYDPDQF